WESHLQPVNSSVDCNGDGIPDTVATTLGLNPCLLDNDGDGTSDVVEIGSNWSHPRDSDRDGVPDALEPGVAAFDTNQLVGIPLSNGERATLSHPLEKFGDNNE